MAVFSENSIKTLMETLAEILAEKNGCDCKITLCEKPEDDKTVEPA